MAKRNTQTKITQAAQTKEIVYSQSDIIDKTFHLLNDDRQIFATIPKETIQQILNCYESVVKDCLREAVEPQTKIIVKIFSGLQVVAQYVPAGKKKLYGKTIQAKEKISVRARVTKYFGYFGINNNVQSRKTLD